VRTILVSLIFLVVLPATDAEARRRRKPRGKVVGQLVAPFLKAGTTQKAGRAYWSYGVDNLHRLFPKPDYREFLVFVDVWDERQVKEPSRLIQIQGAAFVPRISVIPRRAPTETLTLHNLDLKTHRLASPDHPAFKLVTLAGNAKQNVELDNILPLTKGAALTYQLRSKDLRVMRGTIVFLRSTAYTFAAQNGFFQLTNLPRGSHKLKVYYRGKVLHTQTIEVGRKKLKLKPVILKKAQ
jgi:hypothetical protein